jgi:hypothetical protein
MSNPNAIKVVFAADLPECECCGEPFCEKHAQHFADCECVGPTHDGYIYQEMDGVLYAIPIEGFELANEPDSVIRESL